MYANNNIVLIIQCIEAPYKVKMIKKENSLKQMETTGK